MSGHSRRSIFGKTAAAVAGIAVVYGCTPTPAAADSPDVTIVRLGADLNASWAAENEAWEVYDGIPGADDDHPSFIRAAALTARSSKIVGTIEQTPAFTLAGLVVKGRALRWCRSHEPIDAEFFANPMLTHVPTLTTDERLVVSLLADLHVMSGAVA